MPNKYSHAIVLNHYENRGLLSLNNHSKRPPPASYTPPPQYKPSPQSRYVPPPALQVPALVVPPPSLAPAPSFQSNRSSHRTTSSVVTQIYAPQQSSPPTDVPRPSIPTRTSSIPPPVSSSSHHPDFETFSGGTSPVSGSPNTAYSPASSYSLHHITPRTSLSQPAPSIPSKSLIVDDVGPDPLDFDLDPADLSDSYEQSIATDLSINPWEDPDSLLDPIRSFRQSDRNAALLALPTRESSFDDAAPPPIARTPSRKFPTTIFKKRRRVSLSLFRPDCGPDCGSTPYTEITPGPAPIHVATTKFSTARSPHLEQLLREHGVLSGNKTGESSRTSWSMVSSVAGTRDSFGSDSFGVRRRPRSEAGRPSFEHNSVKLGFR